MLTDTVRRRLLRLGQLAVLAVMAVLGILDLSSGMTRNGPLSLLQVLLAVATAKAWLAAGADGAQLNRAALALGVASLVLTAGIAVLIRSDSPSWGFAETLGLLGVLFVVGRRGDARGAVGAATVVGAAVSLLPLRSSLGYPTVVAGLALALCAAGAIGGGVYLRTIAQSRQRAIAAVRTEQRAELARDLHDFIAHHVTGIVVQAQGARFVAEQEPQRVLLALEQIERAGAETMASMRRMVGVLRDPDARPGAPLAPLAGVADLHPLLDAFGGSSGLVTRLHAGGGWDGLPVEVSTSAYRVVMEALTNIRQHAAGARAVHVWVTRTPDCLLVRVADDGVTATGADRADGALTDRPGYGLVGLAERVRAVGGRLTAGPCSAGGWLVEAALPLATTEVPR